MTESEPVSPAKPAAPQPATIRRRLAAFVYESVLLFGVVFVAGLVFSIAMQQRNGLAHHNLMTAWIAVVVGVYFVGLWHRGGQTLPMKTWRLRVVGPRGSPPSIGRATLRYVAAWLWFLPPLALHPLLNLPLPQTLAATAVWFALWAASASLGRERQFPHDRIAGTRVVVVPR
ncbi:putative RDD family membrane protein YckC [Paraburkholderia caballeronis]|uniref:RDD family protein n=1 Tax=Paraburkholderia caballeronis TaxID=416943 RepID=UPI001064C70F|nr:RDD family protein [Paraburkholderia caballeronis]TDV32751.1 putative RDD family membrane protein YckC [Paraburkholderia caballeronis]